MIRNGFRFFFLSCVCVLAIQSQCKIGHEAKSLSRNWGWCCQRELISFLNLIEKSTAKEKNPTRVIILKKKEKDGFSCSKFLPNFRNIKGGGECGGGTHHTGVGSFLC